MLDKYENFLENFQFKIDSYFKEHSEYISCKKGCSACCEVGEYPFSWIEMNYLMQGFLQLPQDLKLKIKANIENIMQQKAQFRGERFEYTCPFLIEGSCSVYSNRGLTCRVHGLAHIKKDGSVNVPYCANEGLNYSNVYKDNVFEAEPIKDILYIDEILKNFDGEMGEIRPLIEWFYNC